MTGIAPAPALAYHLQLTSPETGPKRNSLGGGVSEAYDNIRVRQTGDPLLGGVFIGDGPTAGDFCQQSYTVADGCCKVDGILWAGFRHRFKRHAADVLAGFAIGNLVRIFLGKFRVMA